MFLSPSLNTARLINEKSNNKKRCCDVVAVQYRVQKSTQGSTPIFRTDWKTLKECAVCLENFFVRIAINAAHIYIIYIMPSLAALIANIFYP